MPGERRLALSRGDPPRYLVKQSFVGVEKVDECAYDLALIDLAIGMTS